MKRSGVILTGGLAVLAIAAVMGRSSAQAPAPPVTRVGVCDVGAIFNGYAKRDDLNAQLEANRKRANAEDKRRAKGIEAVEKVMQELKKGSKQFKDRLKQLEKLTIERSVWRQYAEKAFLAEHRQMMEQLYRELLAAIAQTAKAKGFDVIMYREQVDIASQTTTELYKKIAQRKCLYYNPGVDITQQVLDRLNRQYRAKPK
ncbi:hypothetical protein LCGC14_1226230 [marine sediment metagenome]|uniref:Outer membrane chaperone Skp (OmpH) n=1 Tax=marine sediment metagenome TaxID=412755 RepID=A0A0F9NS22_9ZZZZ